jgi:ethanolamine ammonia-lyase small subunit
MSVEEPWSILRRFTEARIGLGRSGVALPTREVLKFSMAHAQARDAVRTPIDWNPIETALIRLGLEVVRVESAANERDIYLRRPDLGRQLCADSRKWLSKGKQAKPDLAIVVGDGLSSTGVMANAVATISALLPHAKKHRWKLGPVVLASQARVALGDDVGGLLNAKTVLVLIGERPGLSSPDSLGAYLTWAPRVGRKDAERNCISNIRAGGLSYDEAAFKVAWLLREAFSRKLTGVNLKDESDFRGVVEAATVVAIPKPAKTAKTKKKPK